MDLTIEQLKDLIVFCRAQRVAQVKIGNAEFVLSPMAYDEATFTTPSTDTDQPPPAEQKYETHDLDLGLLFHSST